ncbi:MAG TPA: hypothetical protein DET40_02050 [Lentisphaeria bacterium]|nr:MAG: hypothetical protein A2X45_10160 [Lentisphaerae bacterium GWF2_50_93]HCE42315.1 hypothetical protein [Lentisphaeria bacterium]
MKKIVKVYDLKKNSTRSMPEEKLSPGMVLANVEGVGKVWVDSAQIAQPSFKHDMLPTRLLPYVIDIMKMLEEVHPQTFEEWIDGFRCDMHPEREIKIWLPIGNTMGMYPALATAQKRELFQLLLMHTMGMDVDGLVNLTPEQASDALKAYNVFSKMFFAKQL